MKKPHIEQYLGVRQKAKKRQAAEICRNVIRKKLDGRLARR